MCWPVRAPATVAAQGSSWHVLVQACTGLRRLQPVQAHASPGQRFKLSAHASLCEPRPADAVPTCAGPCKLCEPVRACSSPCQPMHTHASPCQPRLGQASLCQPVLSRPSTCKTQDVLAVLCSTYANLCLHVLTYASPY